MILQALNRYYDILLADPKSEIAHFGYSTVGVSFALNLSADGKLLDVLPLFDQVQRGKKTVDVPRSMVVPAQAKRAGIKPSPNFLCDNAVFVLGLSDKDAIDPDYAQKRFDAFCQFHNELLNGVNNDYSNAILAFLERYDPKKGREHPSIIAHLDALLKGSNLVFQFRGAYVHDDPIIKEAWEDYQAGKDAVRMQCLVTGREAPVARLHPSLKRVRNANTMGASLVSFNERAYESYNRTKAQGLNSPVSQKATDAYTTTLNYLLSDANPNPKFYLGDSTVVYWAESQNRGYESAFASIFGLGHRMGQRLVDRDGKCHNAV